MSGKEQAYEYVTIAEVTGLDPDGNKVTRTMNLYSSTPAGAFANTIQIEQLYKASENTEVKFIGTFGRTNFEVIDRSRRSTGETN